MYICFYQFYSIVVVAAEHEIDLMMFQLAKLLLLFGNVITIIGCSGTPPTISSSTIDRLKKKMQGRATRGGELLAMQHARECVLAGED